MPMSRDETANSVIQVTKDRAGSLGTDKGLGTDQEPETTVGETAAR